MLSTLVAVAAIVSPAQKGRCSCDGQCVCGCQSGKDCNCLHDGKPLPRREQPKARQAEPKSEPKAEPKPQDKPDEKRPVGQSGDAYPVQPDGVWNFGVDSSRIGGRDRFLFGQQEVSRAEAMRLIEEGIPDDANKLRLTIIGPEADRKRVLADLEGPAFAPLKSGYVVQAFEPTNPIIQGLGFITTGRPTIYLQTPSGYVLHRQDDYDGPDKLATAIRKADPNYDPSRDPDLTRPKPQPGPLGPGGVDLGRVPVWAWALVAAALFLLLRDDQPRESRRESKRRED